MTTTKGRWKGVCTEVNGPDQSTAKGVATFADDTGLSLKSNGGVQVDDAQNLKVVQADILVEGVASPRGVYWSAGAALGSIAYVPATSRLIVDSDASLQLVASDRLLIDTTNGWNVEGVDYTKAQVQDLFSIADNTQGDLFYADANDSLARLPKNTTATRYLANTGGGSAHNPAWDQVDLTNGVKNDLPFGNLAQVSSFSVLGNASSTNPGDVAGIAVGANSVLGRSGSGNIEGIGVGSNAVLCRPGSSTLTSVALSANTVLGRANLDIVGIGVSADQILGRVGNNALGGISCTSAGRALLDDADAAEQRQTLGLYALYRPADDSAIPTSIQTDTAMKFASLPVGTYEVEAFLMAWSSSGLNTLEYGFDTPAGYMRWTGTPDSSGMRNESSIVSVSLTAAKCIWVKGMLNVSSAGAFGLRRRQQGSGTVTLGANSYLKATRTG